MSAWAIKDKAETWDTVCDRAWAGEPQFITRGSSQTVVVISYVDYQPINQERRGAIRTPKGPFQVSDAGTFADVALTEKRLKIGSMKDEIHLPDNFDQTFVELDDQVASMFAGAAS